MATGDDLKRLVMALEGTTSAPHFERTAFKFARIYATLGPDGLTANFKITPDEQELKCLTAPDAFEPVPNAWGRQGWTIVELMALSCKVLGAALRLAWQQSVPKKRSTDQRKSKR
ncbi:MAG: MmcQ/YjbR family DNA-binding protein [Hyphomicrobiaceae bacterium]